MRRSNVLSLPFQLVFPNQTTSYWESPEVQLVVTRVRLSLSSDFPARVSTRPHRRGQQPTLKRRQSSRRFPTFRQFWASTKTFRRRRFSNRSKLKRLRRSTSTRLSVDLKSCRQFVLREGRCLQRHVTTWVQKKFILHSQNLKKRSKLRLSCFNTKMTTIKVMISYNKTILL